jgi:hypothetical protein
MEHRDQHHFTAEDQRAVDDIGDVIDVSVINPRSMLPAYLQLAIYLRGAIIVRQLPPGAPLPSEPEMCERYKVSRDTVRRSMQVLREIGLAETRRGVGHFVTRTPEIQRVVVAPGARVIVRMPQPHEQGELLGLTVFVVTEPGQPPVAYDTAQTVLAFADEDPAAHAYGLGPPAPARGTPGLVDPDGHPVVDAALQSRGQLGGHHPGRHQEHDRRDHMQEDAGQPAPHLRDQR